MGAAVTWSLHALDLGEPSEADVQRVPMSTTAARGRPGMRRPLTAAAVFHAQPRAGR